MELFDNIIDNTKKLLPKDGIVNYYGKILSVESADRYFNCLLTAAAWRNDEAVIFGKRIIIKRMVAWYGDKPFEYNYSNSTKQALPWMKELLELKSLVENESGETFNSCLLNLYHDGEEGVGWHSDGEPDLKKDGAIASLSLGAERKFVFKHKQTKERVEVFLEHGSLLVMKDKTQTFWLHTLPAAKRITQPRISLTFRTIC